MKEKQQMDLRLSSSEFNNSAEEHLLLYQTQKVLQIENTDAQYVYTRIKPSLTDYDVMLYKYL